MKCIEIKGLLNENDIFINRTNAKCNLFIYMKDNNFIGYMKYVRKVNIMNHF